MRRAPAAAPASTSQDGGRWPGTHSSCLDVAWACCPGSGGRSQSGSSLAPAAAASLPSLASHYASARLTYFSRPKAPGLIDTEQMPAAPTLAPGLPTPQDLSTLSQRSGAVGSGASARLPGRWAFKETANNDRWSCHPA